MRAHLLRNLALLIAWVCGSGPATAGEKDELTLTLASGGASLVQITLRRQVDLAEGPNSVEFDVPATLDPASITLSGEGIELLSCMLRLPPAGPEPTLRAHVGREILVNRRQDGASANRQPETIRGTLLSFDERSLVMTTSNRQIPIQIIPRNDQIMEIKLLSDENAPAQRPTLTCGIHVSRLTEGSARWLKLGFQAAGLSSSSPSAQPPQSARFAIVRNETAYAFVDARVAIGIEARPEEGPLALEQVLSLPPNSVARVALPKSRSQ